MNKHVGSISAISGLRVEILMDTNYRPALNEILVATRTSDAKLMVFAYAGKKTLICINLRNNQQLKLDEKIQTTGQPLQLPVGQSALGHVFNALGEVIDGTKLAQTKTISAGGNPPKLNFSEVDKPKVLQTGIKVIDFFAPFVKGRRIGIIGGAGVGKTVLTTEMMHNVADKKTALSFFVGIGERIREGHELFHTLSDRGLIDNTIMFLGQMNENAALRSMVGPSAASVARHFCDEGNDILFFVDNIYRFIQAGNELATMQREIPSEGGYQASLFSDLHRFEDSLNATSKGSITAIQSIYIPADDLGDPAVVEISQQLDSVIVLSREVFERGIFPAVDLLATTSSLLTPAIIGDQHYKLVNEAKRVIRKFYSLRSIIAIVGESELAPVDRQDYEKAQELIQYFSQNMFVTEDLSGRKGEYFTREQTLAGVQAILSGQTVVGKPAVEVSTESGPEVADEATK